jgi:hypothetical protein
MYVGNFQVLGTLELSSRNTLGLGYMVW